MTILHKHTQVGYTLFGIFGGVVLLFIVLAWRTGNGLLVVLLLPLGLILAVFASLTVQVTTSDLSVRFGPGWHIKRVRLADINTVRRCATPGITVGAFALLHMASYTTFRARGRWRSS